MESQHSMEPHIPSLESIRQDDGVNISTQLLIADSLPTTSNHLMFTYKTNTNSNGNLLFPLAANTTKHTHKISWHILLKYLKSQRIVENIEMFKKLKRKQKHDLNTQQFPLEIRQIKRGTFPLHDNVTVYLKDHEWKFQNLKFPLKLGAEIKIFPNCGKIIKDKNKFEFNTKNYKIRSLTCAKLKPHSKLKRSFRKLPIETNLKKFPCPKNIDFEAIKIFPLQENLNLLYSNYGKRLKFPQKQLQYKGKFPFERTSLNIDVRNQRQFQIKKFLETLPNATNYKDQHTFTQFRCKFDLKQQFATHCWVSKFPIHDQGINKICTHFDYCFHNTNAKNWVKLNDSKSLKTSSLPITQNNQIAKEIDNEHVNQVQDAQIHVKENSQPLTATKHTQPPPQAAIAKSMYEGEDGINILADINSINNTHPNKVGYYAEKIERLQDAIVALFEKIQNSLTTSHNNSKHESTNAIEQDYGNDNNRFALTPTMSVTSVRNTESNNNGELLYEKCDLADLCHCQDVQIVECSEVLDTLAETVDYGVTKAKTKSTGSILVKTEAPTSPQPLQPNPINKSEYTSLEDYKNASELLPEYDELEVNEKNNVNVENYLKCDPSKPREERKETVINTCVNNSTSVKANPMTIARLTKSEQENTNEKNYLQQTNILCNDLQNDEMKFEMNKIKGALPSSVSERSFGKHDSLKTASDNAYYGRQTGTNSSRVSTDSTPSNNRLPYSLSSTRNYNESSHTPRTLLKNESSALGTTDPKRSTTSDYLPILSETNARRVPLSSMKVSNDETLSHRRPSLGYLRNTQSTSLLSADTSHYSPYTTSKQTNELPSVNRAVSLDPSSLEDFLPERTRLRRQRRLRNQDSQDECEDPIERLNRLKARISASLSEVKGVLKQYSTDAENENENAANSVIETKEDEKKDGPITFRFVKKVRRRSIYIDDDESKQTEAETNEELPKEKLDNNCKKQQQQVKDETDNCKLEIISTLPTENCETIKVSTEKPIENLDEEVLVKTEQKTKQPTPLETCETKLNKNLYTLEEEVQESFEDIKHAESKQPHIDEQNESEKISKFELQTVKLEAKGAIPKPSVKHEINKLENDARHETTKKTKKKIIIKSKDHSRRASLAAVEASKIEPPVKTAIPANIQRRPSDSEAVVKKKLITAKVNTSGVVEEVTPKPKIVKAKKSSITNSNNLLLATTETKPREGNTVITMNNHESDDHVKPIDKGNKLIHSDNNKDVLMPTQTEKQQQINTEITRQTNSLLSTQLVIDDAASLNEKTIENSVLPPKQQQQKQQLEQDQQATIKPTATNLNTNDLQAKGAMLENGTTVLSSSTDSAANGQIKRENNIQQQEDFHDLLQHEATIIKPSTTNIQNDLKVVKKIENQISKKEESAEKLSGNLESVQTPTKEQQQKRKAPIQYQQVIATADVAHVKSEGDINGKASLNEICVDKTATPTLVRVDQKQQLQQQLLAKDEQSLTNVDDTKTLSSPHISISSTADITHKTTTASSLSSETAVEGKAELSAKQQSTMPELKLTPAPVQTADIISHPEHHKKKIVRQTSADTTKKLDVEKTKTAPENKEVAIEKTTQVTEQIPAEPPTHETEQVLVEPSLLETDHDELIEECSESTEVSESSQEATETSKKERKVKKKVIIKRQKRRLSIGDSFFHPINENEAQTTEIETLEKPIAYVSDDDDEASDEKDEATETADEPKEEKKPLKSCILHKEYNIGDEVLYAERFKKTQIKWRRGRIKERITSISYLLDIDGKDVSSHINYLKKYTGRKVSFGGKEYLEIDYEQLAEEEEKAERLKKRSYSIWNMV